MVEKDAVIKLPSPASQRQSKMALSSLTPGLHWRSPPLARIALLLLTFHTYEP